MVKCKLIDRRTHIGRSTRHVWSCHRRNDDCYREHVEHVDDGIVGQRDSPYLRMVLSALCHRCSTIDVHLAGVIAARWHHCFSGRAARGVRSTSESGNLDDRSDDRIEINWNLVSKAGSLIRTLAARNWRAAKKKERNISVHSWRRFVYVLTISTYLILDVHISS